MGYDKFEGLNQITDAYQKAVGKSLLINESEMCNITKKSTAEYFNDFLMEYLKRLY